MRKANKLEKIPGHYKNIGPKESPYTQEEWGPQKGYFTTVSDHDYITRISQIEAEKFSKKELVKNIDRVFYDGDLRGYNGYLNQTPEPRTVDFDGLQAIDIANNGLKVQINPSTFTKPLNIQVPDEKDKTYVREGREQRTVIRQVILGNSILSFQELNDTLREALRQGATETEQEQGQILEGIKQSYKKILYENIKPTKKNSEILKKAGSVLQIPKTWWNAGFKNRFINRKDFINNYSEYLTYIQSTDPEKTDPLVGYYNTMNDWENDNHEYIDIYEINKYLDNSHVFDLERMCVIPIELANNSTKNNLGLIGKNYESQKGPPILGADRPYVPIEQEILPPTVSLKSFLGSEGEASPKGSFTPNLLESLKKKTESIKHKTETTAEFDKERQKQERKYFNDTLIEELKNKLEVSDLSHAIEKYKYLKEATTMKGGIYGYKSRHEALKALELLISKLEGMKGQGKNIRHQRFKGNGSFKEAFLAQYGKKGHGDLGNNNYSVGQKKQNTRYPKNVGNPFGYPI